MDDTRYHHAQAAEAQRLAQLVRDTEHELRTNPDYQPYFAGYDPASVERFIAVYAQRKVHYLKDGPSRVNWTIGEASKLRDEAYERLWDIQQKKLFDLQCQWRAGLLKLPDVDLCEQFRDFGTHPEHCVWLPPITPGEVAAYRDYLLGPECEDVGFNFRARAHHHHWQDYANIYAEGLKTAEGYDRQPYHPWYRYADAHLGPGPQLGRPDVRGPRQEFFRNLGYAATHPPEDGDEDEDTTPPTHDLRPTLGPHGSQAAYDEVVARFDKTPNLAAMRRAYNNAYNEAIDDEILSAQHLLGQAKTLLPVPDQAPDWRPVVLELATQFRKQLLADALPLVYDDYCLRLQTGLQPAPPYPDSRAAPDEMWVEIYRQMREDIRRGREMSGEPQDVDY